MKAVQYRRALALAAAHGHHWATAVRLPLRDGEDERDEAIAALDAELAAGGVSIDAIRRVSDALDAGPCGGIGPSLDEGGRVEHLTGSGRVWWRVHPDGAVEIEVRRPHPDLVRLRDDRPILRAPQDAHATLRGADRVLRYLEWREVSLRQDGTSDLWEIRSVTHVADTAAAAVATYPADAHLRAGSALLSVRRYQLPPDIALSLAADPERDGSVILPVEIDRVSAYEPERRDGGAWDVVDKHCEAAGCHPLDEDARILDRVETYLSQRPVVVLRARVTPDGSCCVEHVPGAHGRHVAALEYCLRVLGCDVDRALAEAWVACPDAGEAA
jgi:hypothetical protein